jgi:DNA (cytosine-5)-methyltransferase 1
MTKLRLLELFGGIGACTKALKKLGIDVEVVDYVEIDRYAVASYNAINNTNFKPQDITQWDKDVEVDFIMHGSPCQDFSLAGKQAGGDEGSGTRSSLMYETIRIVEKLKPKYVIWENVKNLLSKKHRLNFDSYLEIMESLGYKSDYQVLNAKDFGIPQNRERVFTISIRNDIKKSPVLFLQKQELKLILQDLLEIEVDKKYYLSKKMIKNISALGSKTFKNNNSKINLDIARPLTSTMHKMHRAGSDNYISDDLPRNYDLSILIKNATKKGYMEAHEGDSINLAYSNSKTRRGRVGVQISQTLQCNDNMGVVVDNLKIRKLTPKECWRLMGFDDEDFEKAEKVNSNTQLYKQAGNSIVVNVLMAIFNELLKKEGE